LGISALIDTLPVFENLEILGLGNVGMEDENCVELSYALLSLPKLRSLSIHSNKIGDSGLISLGILVASDQITCSTLHIGENQFTSKGLVPFMKGFQTNSTIKHLYMNDIVFQSDGIRAMGKGLSTNTTLQSLNLGNCAIDDESINLMKNFLMVNKTINTLHLWKNQISSEGAAVLCEILEKQNHTLTLLSLSDNFIDDEELLAEIKAFLKQNEEFLNPKPKKALSPPKIIKEEPAEEDEKIKEDTTKMAKPPLVPSNEKEESESDEDADENELANLEGEITKQDEEEVKKHNDATKKDTTKPTTENGDNTQVWKGFEKVQGTDLLKSKFT
jgi:hypothetical protein